MMIGFSDAELARARDLVSPQPAPANTGSQPVWPLVIDDMLRMFHAIDEPIPPLTRLVVADMTARDAYGRDKYKAPLTCDNGRDHLKDAYQEALDLIAYLKTGASLSNVPLDDESGLAVALASYPLYNTAIGFVFALRQAIAERDGEAI